MPMSYTEFKKLVPTLTPDELRSWWELMHKTFWDRYVTLTDKEWFLARRVLQRRIQPMVGYRPYSEGKPKEG